MAIPLAERHNMVRWSPRGAGGVVESLFIKLHLPESGAAFWARYTLRRPGEGHGAAVGCLWAVFTDASGEKTAGCDVWPAEEVAPGSTRFYLRIGPGELSMGRATGRVAAGGGIEWDLTFETGVPCLAHFPFDWMYEAGFPRNKLASPHATTRFYGTIKIKGSSYCVDGARGMQGHNWGPAVADNWAWCHMNVFEGEEDAVCEAVSSALRAGPFTLPAMTVVYLRVRGREVLMNGPLDMVMARSEFDGLKWVFSSCTGQVKLSGVVTAAPDLTVGLDYVSTDGRAVRCENSNLADGHVTVDGLPGGHLELRAVRNATLELGGGRATRIIPVLARG